MIGNLSNDVFERRTSTGVVMEMGSLPHFQISGANQISDRIFQQKKGIKENIREILYLRWINDKCYEFLKMLNKDEANYEDNYCGSKAKELTKILKEFLNVKMKYKFQNISNLKFKYFDANNVEILEEQLDNFRDLYVDPDSYEFDEEAYELNIDIQFPGFRELFKLICLFNDKIEKDKPIINLISDSDSDSD